MRQNKNRSRTPELPILTEAQLQAAFDLVEQLLVGSGGPFSENLLVRAAGHFLSLSPIAARAAVRHCVSIPGSIERIGPQTYDLFTRILTGSRIRLRPRENEITFGFLLLTEADKCFVTPEAFFDPHASDEPVLLRFPGREQAHAERLLYGEKGGWRLTGLGIFYNENQVRAGDSLILERLDPLTPELSISRATAPVIDLETRNGSLVEACTDILLGFGPGPHLLHYLMRRLLARSFFMDRVPPAPLAQVLSADDRFSISVDRGTVELVGLPKTPIAAHKEDPLAAGEPRYFGRDQTPPSGRSNDPVTLACRHCDRSFTDTDPFAVSIEGFELFAGRCPSCDRIASTASDTGSV